MNPNVLILSVVSKETQTLGFCRSAVYVALVILLTAAPAAAQRHLARLSADLADHLAADSPATDVIVDGDAASIARLVRQYNVVVTRWLRRGGAVLRVNAGQLAALQEDESVDHLSGDIRYRTSSGPGGRPGGPIEADAMAQGIGADQVWTGVNDLPPLSGRGVTVAVIDSGFDLRHHAIKSRTLLTVDFTGGDGVDRFGHGTHVAALIAGEVGQSADTRMYRGVAPGAYLLNLRVLGDDGSGTASDVIEAIDWSIDHRDDYNIRIINLSLGAPVLQPYRDDPVCAAVERAVRAGIVVVAAAGNVGLAADGRRVLGGIVSPGNSPYAVAVGALDTQGTADRSDDVVAAFSSQRADTVRPGAEAGPGGAGAAGDVGGVGGEPAVGEFPGAARGGERAELLYPGVGDEHGGGSGERGGGGIDRGASGLQPLTTKAALQLTSTFLPASGLIQGGSGSLNVLAAAAFVRDGSLADTTIAGIATSASQIMMAPREQVARDSRRGFSIVRVELAKTVGKFPNAPQQDGW